MTKAKVNGIKTVVLKRKKIDLAHSYKDHECAVLAMMGFSDRLIRENTGFSNNQIQTRLRIAAKLGAPVKRKEYRDGTSQIARAVVQRVGQVTEDQLMSYIEQHAIEDKKTSTKVVKSEKGNGNGKKTNGEDKK